LALKDSTASLAAFYRQVPDDDVLASLYPAHDLAGAERRLRDF
jgi:truncated hemoglobin YjbI